MNREEKISLYGYIEDLYQAMQIGNIIFEPKHSSELYDLISKVLKENQELKKQLSNSYQIKMKRLQQENRKLKQQLSNSYQIKNQQKEFIEYLETEKDRLARECSPIYEDGLGKTRLVSEDIFNEINDVLSKYKEIVGGSNDIT